MNPITKAKPPTNPNNNNCNHASNYYYSGNAAADGSPVSGTVLLDSSALSILGRTPPVPAGESNGQGFVGAAASDRRGQDGPAKAARRARFGGGGTATTRAGDRRVPDDVRLMVVHDGDDGDGVAVGVGVTVASIQQQQQSNDNDNDGPGFHL
eukprot:CAMPEP_0168166480 /NCGR_PEP_ID=MMETSP0139_2-20121125/2049_1 /TAXON_ID=44445 /ORGANISM="Pseudo-nitzschia australis, Strain 10249 10 AB" /LENGTH=152 /DNA_ID=CAMNT_0008083679 /DNA_START=77 /DNA_END=534 /DNA_ORIENTATION=-